MGNTALARWNYNHGLKLESGYCLGSRLSAKLCALLRAFSCISIVWLFYFTMYLFAGSTICNSLSAVLSIHRYSSSSSNRSICLCVNPSSCLTNYATGTMVIYYGYGYVDSKSWYKTGFIMSIFMFAFG